MNDDIINKTNNEETPQITINIPDLPTMDATLNDKILVNDEYGNLKWVPTFSFATVDWDKRLKTLDDILKIQCDDGNWNYDEYMFGFANALILAQAIMTDAEPEYLERPKEWIKDKMPKEVNESAYDDAMRSLGLK